MYQSRVKFFLAFFVFALLSCAQTAFAQATFLMGEDVIHPSGAVLTVNEINRATFAGGLSGKGKQDEIRLNLTMVNTGIKTFRIDPNRDFRLELSRDYEPAPDQEKRATSQAFSIFPSSQTRVNLYFKILADEQVQPVLIFNLEDSQVRIVCSPKLEKLAQKAASQALSAEEMRELARFYVEAGRFSSAEEILQNALAADSGDNQLWMLLAAVKEGNYDNRAAAECLDRIDPALIKTYEEAAVLAKQALKLGHYRLAIAVLEPYELVNRLDLADRVILARSYYYEKDLLRSEKILESLLNSREREVFFTLGNIKDRQEKITEAIELWEKAIEIDSSYCEAYFNIGVGYYKQDKITKAREYWQKVLYLRPDSQILRATEDALAATDY